MRRTILILCLLFGISALAMGQTMPDTTSQEDPFKNDPFFSAPLSEFFDNSSSRDDSTRQSRDVGNLVSDLNEEGIDFRGVIEAGPYNSNALYSVYPNLPMIHYNRVNSLFLGIKKERMQWYHNDNWLGIPDIQMHGLIGYATGRGEWEYAIGLERLLGANDHLIIGGEYHNASATNDEWRVGLNETSLTAFMAGYDYLDYYKQRGWGAYLLARTARFFEGGIAFSDDRFTSLDRETSWALFGAGDRFRLNPPVDRQNGAAVDTVNLSSITVSASYNPKRLLISRSFTFSVSGMAEFTDTGIGTTSDFDYAKYTGELISYVNFDPGTVLKYRLRMSSITGSAPRFKQLYLGGVGTLRALPFKSLGGGNQMLLSNAELQLGQPAFGSEGWVDFDDFYLSLFLDSGWVTYDAGLEESNTPFSGLDKFKVADLRHSGGIGIGSSLIRCELAWDLNNTDRAPVFWLRFNPTF